MQETDRLRRKIQEEEEREKELLQFKIIALENELTNDILSQKELENSVESVRVERDFYYDSLLAIEVSLNNKMKEEPSLRNTTYARDLVEILESPDQ